MDMKPKIITLVLLITASFGLNISSRLYGGLGPAMDVLAVSPLLGQRIFMGMAQDILITSISCVFIPVVMAFLNYPRVAWGILVFGFLMLLPVPQGPILGQAFILAWAIAFLGWWGWNKFRNFREYYRAK